jgi:site-specific DNA recombinase
MAALREPNPQPTALVYCRVSTKGQEQDGTSLDSQESLCVAHAVGLGYTVAGVVREVYSGAELYDRPRLTEVRHDVAAGRYDALVCYCTDRLSRDPIHLMLVAEECARAECALVFVLEPMDDTDEGRFIAYAKGYASKKERERIRERSLRGKHTRALMGKVHGMGPELYGWRRDKAAGVRVIEESEAAVVKRINTLIVRDRMSYRAIAKQFTAEGVRAPGGGTAWRADTILRIVQNRAYMGEAVEWRWHKDTRHTAANGRVVRITRRPVDEQIALPAGVCPAILSAEEWQAAVSAVRQQSGDHTRNEKLPYLLRGHIFCAVCGRKLHPSGTRSAKGTLLREYRCSSYHSPQGACGAHRVPASGSSAAENVEDWVWAHIREVYDHPEVIAAELERERAQGPDPQLTRDLQTARRNAARCAHKQQDLLAHYDPDHAAFPWALVEREVARLEAERTGWETQTADLEGRLRDASVATRQLERFYATCQHVAANLPTLTFDERVTALEALQIRVSANGHDWALSGRIPFDGFGPLAASTGVDEVRALQTS